MAHATQPIIWKQTISTFLFLSPKSLAENNECFQSVCSQLIIKDNSFIFADLSKIDVPNNLKWHRANYLFGNHLNWQASWFLKISYHGNVVLDIVDVNDLWIKSGNIFNVGLEIFLNALNHFLNDYFSAFN
jgi:hypothetical protein